MAKGDALRFLGQYPTSLAFLDRAGQAFLDLGDEVGWARTRIGWVVSAHRLGRGAEALAVVDTALDVLTRHEEWLRAGGLTLNTAVVCRDLGQYQRARHLCDRAEQLYRALGPAGEMRAARALANKAIVLTLQGDFRAALTLHEQARAVLGGGGETVAMIFQDQNIAYVYAGLGHYTRALHLLADAFATAEAVGVEALAAAIASNMVECYLRLNRYAEALDQARRGDSALRTLWHAHRGRQGADRLC